MVLQEREGLKVLVVCQELGVLKGYVVIQGIKDHLDHVDHLVALDLKELWDQGEKEVIKECKDSVVNRETGEKKEIGGLLVLQVQKENMVKLGQQDLQDVKGVVVEWV